MRTGKIYKLIFPNGKVYIGQTIRKMNERVRSHMSQSFNKNETCYNSKVCRAIRKYANFEYCVLFDEVLESKLDEIETEMINKYDSFNNGYNSTVGGGGVRGFKHSEETKRRLSEVNTGNILTKEAKRKISIANKGNTPTEETRKKISKANKGKTRTKETKRKISMARTGIKFSDEHRKNISKASAGRKASKETRQKMSEARKGIPRSEETKKKISAGNIGKTKTKETREKISKSKSGENSQSAKLTWEIVDLIREEYSTENMSYGRLADKYNVGKTAIDNIINFRSWKPENDPRNSSK